MRISYRVTPHSAYRRTMVAIWKMAGLPWLRKQPQYTTYIEFLVCRGDLHREDGPALIYKSGREDWFYMGKRHRLDGPAIDGTRFKAWMRDGKLHREDGPAIAYANGRKQWFLDGVRVYCDQDGVAPCDWPHPIQSHTLPFCMP